MKGRHSAWILAVILMMAGIFKFPVMGRSFDKGTYAIIMKSRDNWYNELASEGFNRRWRMP